MVVPSGEERPQRMHLRAAGSLLPASQSCCGTQFRGRGGEVGAVVRQVGGVRVRVQVTSKGRKKKSERKLKVRGPRNRSGPSGESQD